MKLNYTWRCLEILQLEKCTNIFEVSIFGGEKVRISLIFCVSGNGYKLLSVLIFKAKKDSRLEKTLNELD